MNAPAIGPVAREMIARLESHLAPARMNLRDDSEQHRGHGGYNPAGESHFFLSIEAATFAGLNRVQRQRLVYKALGDLMHERVHALAMETRAPGE
ncbi:BolA family transcriptional regulator [Sphingomonas sp. LHG3406-1]|uniref:BolA family protein n=1 Tax=Sphingomonas sp. LHG3406-1 TaxID=2804617 RepID=UPI00262E92DA|nr:BolA family protein [Sphingomonas sp. LHG3406-1]